MNTFLEIQIRNMIMYLDAFQKSCQTAALKDDGKIDKAEQRKLDKIKKATEKYKQILNKEL